MEMRHAAAVFLAAASQRTTRIRKMREIAERS
jgi:hypothetical protein